MLVINWQLWHSARTATETAARQSIEHIDNILDEAHQATDSILPIAQGSCTPDTQFLLSREAALKPHIRAVTLLKGNTLWCSSFTGNSPPTFQQESLSTSRLTLYRGDQLAPGIPLLVYLTPAYGGYVAVSISDVHLRDALVPVQENQPLTLVVGNQQLTHQGEVRSLPVSSERFRQVNAFRYPFSIGYTLPSYLSPGRLLSQGGVLLIMTAILSLTAGGLLRRYRAKYTTPAENLKKALERGEIVPYYQPIVDGRTGIIHGFEVLARWKHPRDGFIPPDTFIPVAEKSGLIIPLTRYLMEKVATDLRPVMSQLPDGLHISINISAAHGNSPHLTDDCLAFLASFGEKPVTLVLEITEREPLTPSSDVRQRLAALRSQGVVLALDDFGTGYSGLSYLNELQIDFIKIDHSFISRITDEPCSTRLVDCVIEMAQKLSIRIVAEGVETRSQVDYLNLHKIPLLQGYYFFRPLPFPALAKAMLLQQGYR
jgi:sensor c-di-GMP phosphodiesterase-like protein